MLSNARVKLGTNGKVAIIGTDLSNRIEPFTKDIKEMVGSNIELFNETYQKSKKFAIDGVERSWDEIVGDWEKLKSDYPDNIVPYEKVSESLMYKANEQFIKRIKSEGFTVIDIQGTYKSKFYDMEVQNIFN